MKDITEKTLKCVKFVIERYIQKSDKSDELVSCQQHVKSRSQTSSLQFFSDWAIDRTNLWAAICKFDFLMKDLYLNLFNITDESSVSVNFTKSDVQQMIDAAV